MRLNDMLYALRKERGLSQQQVAESLNVSRQAISRWEVGASVPSMENLVALSKLYAVSVDELLGNSAPVEEPPADIAPQPEEIPSPQSYPIKKSLICLWVAVGLSMGFALGLGYAHKNAPSSIAPYVPIDSIAWEMPSSTERLHIDGADRVDNPMGIDLRFDLSPSDGRYVYLYVDNRGTVPLAAQISNQQSRCFEPGERGYLALEVKPGLLGRFREYRFQVSVISGSASFRYDIVQMDVHR